MAAVLQWYFDGTLRPMTEFETFARGWNAAALWIPLMQKRFEERNRDVSKELATKTILDILAQNDGLFVRELVVLTQFPRATVSNVIAALWDEGRVEIGGDKKARIAKREGA